MKILFRVHISSMLNQKEFDMRPYRYPKKLRPDVDFTTLRRNLSYITTQIFLRRHVISRTSGEITRILYEIIIASCSFFQKETLLKQWIYDNRSSEGKTILVCSLLDRCFYFSSVRYSFICCSNIGRSFVITSQTTLLSTWKYSWTI